MVAECAFKGIKNQILYFSRACCSGYYFCKDCGIYTHHHPRINPSLTAFNVGCIDDIDTFKLEGVKIADGNNHPLDKKN